MRDGSVFLLGAAVGFPIESSQRPEEGGAAVFLHGKPGLLTCLSWVRASTMQPQGAGWAEGTELARKETEQDTEPCWLTGRCLQLGSQMDFQDLLRPRFPSWAGHNHAPGLCGPGW